MLGLGVDPNALGLGQVDDLLERRDLEEPVERRVLRAHERQTLLRPQGLELGQREILGEPACGEDHAVDRPGRLDGPRTRDDRPRLSVVSRVGLVPDDQLAVLGGHQVGLDVVRPHLDRQLVARSCARGGTPGPAMTDHDRQTAPAPTSVMPAAPGRRAPAGSPSAASAAPSRRAWTCGTSAAWLPLRGTDDRPNASGSAGTDGHGIPRLVALACASLRIGPGLNLPTGPGSPGATRLLTGPLLTRTKAVAARPAPST